MFYYLFEYLQHYDIPGARLMNYVTFRSGCALVLSLFIATFFGSKIIRALQAHQIGEIVRDMGFAGEASKKGTPTMGGIIIIMAIVIPCLLVSRLANIYMLLMLLTTVWLGAVGFADDWLKIKYKNKEGLKGWYKILWQTVLGVIVGITIWQSDSIVIRQNYELENVPGREIEVVYRTDEVKSPETTIPFVKNHNFNYASLTRWAGSGAETAGWILFTIVCVLVICGTSNGANLNDGMDGLCTGVSAIIGVALAIMAYLGANIIYASYLNIMYAPGSEELVVFSAAFIGALIGFLWFNAAPAEVFMGDTGSLTIGGIIAVFSLLIHKELLLPLLCGIFFVEAFSVILQTRYFKFSHGGRVFKCTPIHDHFRKPGDGSIRSLIQWPYRVIPESKIVTRFWIIGIFLAVLTFATLKIR